MNLLTPIVTASGWIYSAGALHAQEGGHFGRPMYYPSEEGERVYLGREYTKYLRRPQTELLPAQPYRECPQIDPWSVVIPSAQIVHCVDTRSAFQSWLAGSDLRVDIVKHILKGAGISMDQCGLGGSVGLGCETTASDIDLLIFGSALALSCRRAIEDALLMGELALMTNETVSSYARRYSDLYGLDLNYLHTVFARDLSKVYYRGQKISFIFTYGECERDKIPLRLYDGCFDQAREIRLKARVVDGTASWLYPRKYTIEQATGRLYQVWSHHWLRDPVTPAGTLVEVVGRDLGDGTISLTDLRHHIAPLNI